MQYENFEIHIGSPVNQLPDTTHFDLHRDWYRLLDRLIFDGLDEQTLIQAAKSIKLDGSYKELRAEKTPDNIHQFIEQFVTQQQVLLCPIQIKDSPRGPFVKEPVWQIFIPDDPRFQAQIFFLQTLVSQPDDLKQVGEFLHKSLFPGWIGDIFASCLDDLEPNQGLRIRLQTDDPQLSLWPWEYCYNQPLKSPGKFLALRTITPIVRYIEVNFKIKKLASDKPRLLVAMASPSGPADLNQADAEKAIRAKLDELGPNLVYDFLPNATQPKLKECLAQQDYDIFHFIGHGLIKKDKKKREYGALAFEKDDADRSQDPIDFEELGYIFDNSSVKLIVLTACETAVHDAGNIFKGVAQSLVASQIPAVIAMQFSLKYALADDFMVEFYRHLSHGDPLDEALTEARIGVFHQEEEKLSWGVPVLFMQTNDARDCRLWEIEHQPLPAAIPAQPEIPKALRPYLRSITNQHDILDPTLLIPDCHIKGNLSLSQLFIDIQSDLTPSEGESAIPAHADSALVHISNNTRLLLLGDPGSGKTSILRFISSRLATHLLNPQTEDIFSQKWNTEKPLPILIRLIDLFNRQFEQKEYRFDPQSATAFWEFFKAEITESKQDNLIQAIPGIDEYAQEGRVIFLLDGLDDLSIEQQEQVWQAILALDSNVYADCRWIITCRIRSIAYNLVPSDVAQLVLLPLDEERIDRFVNNWYSALSKFKHPHKVQQNLMGQLLRQATRDPHFLELAQNPLLLTIMALVHTNSNRPISEKRAYLYQQCLDTLLIHWQMFKESQIATSENLPFMFAETGLDQNQLLNLLSEISFKAIEENDEDLSRIPEPIVLQIARKYFNEDIIKVAYFLQYVDRRAHLLLGPQLSDEPWYKFTYPSLQNYLAARFLATNGRFQGQSAQLATQGDNWRDILSLTVGKLAVNDNNWQTALYVLNEVRPEKVPLRDDENGWRAIWLAAEMVLTIRLMAPDDNNVQREVVRLQKLLQALLENGRLRPHQRAKAALALARLGDQREGVATLEPSMIPIPAGAFLMGEEQHQISLEAFTISRYPITNAQYRYFLEANGYSETHHNCWTPEGWQKRIEFDWSEPASWQATKENENKPVTGISWYEALAYANWLSAKTGRNFHLPSEAQWERAARHVDGRLWPWGNAWQNRIINSLEAMVGEVTPVGIFPEGRADCGAHDLSGNIWEWCSTRLFDAQAVPYPVPYQPDDGRENLNVDSLRILRGGSFNNNKDEIKTFSNDSREPDERNAEIGFRVVES